LDIGDTVQVIMFAVVPGKSAHIELRKPGIMPTAGFDSHSSSSHQVRVSMFGVLHSHCIACKGVVPVFD
jgi:hypothetical protein